MCSDGQSQIRWHKKFNSILWPAFHGRGIDIYVNEEKTGKVHCKAVRKLNEIQPTAVKDKEKVFYKEGDVITKLKKDEATKKFIDVFANSGYEYAQKASNDLKSIRESDEYFKKEILQHASHDILQNIEEII